MEREREIKIARNSRDENRRTLQLLESLAATEPQDIADRARQLANAKKLQAILDQFTVVLETD